MSTDSCFNHSKKSSTVSRIKNKIFPKRQFPSFNADFNPLLKIAIPLILTGSIQSALSFFENVFLAHLNQKALAAGALVSWLFFIMISLIFGIFNATNVLVAHQYGAKNHTEISKVIRDALLLALMVTPLAFLLFWYAPDIFLLLGQKQEIVDLAKLYLHALAWGIFPKLILIVGFELLIGLGHSRVVMIATMISTPFYILLSYSFIFGQFGLPKLAIAGAGWGMAIADWIIATIVWTLLGVSKTYKTYIRALFTFAKPSYILEILHIGIPIGAMFCVEVGFFFLMTLFMGRIGIETLAGNQIAFQYLGFLISVIFSIAQAITVRMGHLIGAKEIDAAKRAAYAGIIFSLSFMVIIAQFYWFWPSLLISVDLDIHDPLNFKTVYYAKEFLFALAFFQLAESIRLSLFGALRSLKDTRFTLVTSILCYWCIGLPVGYCFSISLNLGAQWFWWAIVVGISFGVILLFKRFTLMINRY